MSEQIKKESAFGSVVLLIFVMFVFGYYVPDNLVKHQMKEELRISTRNEVRSDFIQMGIDIGAIEYRIVDKSTGKTEPFIIIPEKQGEKLSKWLEIPMYIDPNITVATSAKPIVSEQILYNDLLYRIPSFTHKIVNIYPEDRFPSFTHKLINIYPEDGFQKIIASYAPFK